MTYNDFTFFGTKKKTPLPLKTLKCTYITCHYCFLLQFLKRSLSLLSKLYLNQLRQLISSDHWLKYIKWNLQMSTKTTNNFYLLFMAFLEKHWFVVSLIYVFLKNPHPRAWFLLLFRDRGREGERETSGNVCAHSKDWIHNL